MLLDGTEAQPALEFIDADIPHFVCFNTTADSVTFAVQQADDASYNWIELDRSGVARAVLNQSGDVVTLKSLPPGTSVRSLFPV